MIFKRFVTATQFATLSVVVITVIFLFVRQPPEDTSTGAAAPSPGAALFADNCASCHGPDGKGATAPQLVGRVVQQYPVVADQIAVVTDGKGSMPSFRGVLSADQIIQVVDFTRGVGSGPDPSGTPGPVDAKALYLDKCAACHGDFGEGTYAPAFKGGVLPRKYPDPAAQTAIILDGSPGTSMRSFRNKLTPAELQAIVDYTRSL